jgi:hypothetical protein
MTTPRVYTTEIFHGGGYAKVILLSDHKEVVESLKAELAEAKAKLERAFDALGSIGTGLDPESKFYCPDFKEDMVMPFKNMAAIGRYAFKVRDSLTKTATQGEK